MPAPLIEVDHITKQFAGLVAVDQISFEVRRGELLGFLGPNGAGKTTTINMLTGLAKPDAGTIKIAGVDCSRNPKKTQHLLGVVPDESNLYAELTGFENLCFCAALYGLRKKQREDRANQLLDNFGLAQAARRKFEQFSKGMKRRLTIAAGIIHDPEILFLDEPTTGVDVVSARQIRQLIADWHRGGKTIFLTTHYIEEAEKLCERVVFIVNGQIARVDTVARLLEPEREKHRMVITINDPNPALCSSLSSAFPGLDFAPESDRELRVEADKPISIGPVIGFIENQGAMVAEARRVHPSLEDIFVQITGIESGAMKKEKSEGA